MASFKEQVEGLASISIGTTPTNSELTQILTDGAKDTINRILSVNANEKENFTSTTESQDDSGILIQGEVISVTRMNGNADYLMPCTKVRTSDRYEATNIDSLKYRSAYNPAFYILDGKIYGIPISNNSATNKLVVTQLNYPTVEYSSTLIPSFPKKYEHLVTYYACMMSLLALAGSLHGDTVVTDAIGAVNTNIDSALAEIAILKSEILNSKSELDSSGGLNTTEEALLHAKKLFSDDAGFNALSNVTDDLSNSTSVTGWLEEEDPEMVTSTIQAIGLELKRAELDEKKRSNKAEESIKRTAAKKKPNAQ